MVLLLFLTGILLPLIAYLIYHKGSANSDFFKTWRIKYSKPDFMFGHSKKMMTRKENMYDFVSRIYSEFPEEKAVGVWDMRTPKVLIRDPSLLKHLTVKVFDHFMNHQALIDETVDPILGNSLGGLSGQKWKDMRSTFSPAFTGSKMRLMLQLINEVTEQLVDYVKSDCEKNEGGLKEYDMKDLLSKYTNDTIALCAFGIKVDTLKDDQNEFYLAGKSIMDFGTFWSIVMFMCIRFLPKNLVRMLNISPVAPKTRKFFMDVVLSTMEYREKNNIIRPDMISLLMEAKKGTLHHSTNTSTEQVRSKSEGFATVDESQEWVGKSGDKSIRRQWTDEEIVAQSVVFFLAGFENNSTVMTMAAYELAINPDIQQKLFEEVKMTKEALEGKVLSYEVLHGMHYLDAVVCETLRKWPPAPFTDRVCNKKFDYKDAETGLEMHFEKGDSFWMPIYGYHMDEKYFPEPQVFNPDRFSVENRHLINADAYLPFGVGPRVCPANRFVLMAVKALLYYVVLDFEVVVVEKTQVPLVLKKDMTSIAKGIVLGLKRR